MSGYDLARDADVLLHDSQYREHEYGSARGVGALGHRRARMEFARKAAVERVVLFHHDPYHDDDELEELLAEARGMWAGRDEHVVLASERMTITLADGSVTVSETA